jgi:hypothetical protein
MRSNINLLLSKEARVIKIAHRTCENSCIPAFTHEGLGRKKMVAQISHRLPKKLARRLNDPVRTDGCPLG